MMQSFIRSTSTSLRVINRSGRGSYQFLLVSPRSLATRRNRVRSACVRKSQIFEKFNPDYDPHNNNKGLAKDDTIDSITEAMELSSGQQTFDEYLESAHMSPWVPTPDMVGRGMLKLANANKNDIHFDLGSGDGRLNFLAVDEPFCVKRSIGIDVDEKLVDFSRERARKLFGRRNNQVEDHNATNDREGNVSKSNIQYRPEIDFICLDLLATNENGKHRVDLTSCSVMTLYFVESALVKLQPLLEKQLRGSGCRVVTNNYKFESAWLKPERVEIVAGMPIHLYIL